jgi:hypothetical protein
MRRTIRVFVSSTFKDMTLEREALRTQVFQPLHEFCARRGHVFQAIDLRWGVSPEAATEQATMRICLEELRRCQTESRPNFIFLLGDRYGWRPLPSTLPAAEFDRIIGHVRDTADRDALRFWYRLDKNATPPYYDLRSRKDAALESKDWVAVEARLRASLAAAAASVALSAERRLVYVASATEQELVAGVLSVADARQHVFGFFRTIRTPDGVAIAHASGRDADAFLDISADGHRDEAAAARLASLKKQLRDTLGDNILERETTLSGTSVDASYIDGLCAEAYARLLRVIEAEMSVAVAADARTEEIEAHLAFGRAHVAFENGVSFFCGRAATLGAIATYLDDTLLQPLVVVGPSGSGKSALIAQAIAAARASHPKARIVARFIGGTPSSPRAESLFASLRDEIHHAYSKPLDGAKAGSAQASEIVRALAFADNERPIIVFVDGLDQLEGLPAHALFDWLPKTLPRHVHVVASMARRAQYPRPAGFRVGRPQGRVSARSREPRPSPAQRRDSRHCP